MSITLIIVVLTSLISFIAFSNDNLRNDLIFYPPAITERNQWYRFVTCGFIHADIPHLLFNMYSLYMFGEVVERGFQSIFGEMGTLLYVVMYLTALVACLLPTYFAHKDDAYYSSLGASGAIAAVVFVYIFLAPTDTLRLVLLPIPLPAFIFGALYLIISSVLAKRGGSHINHSAHFWGSVYGVFFLVVAGFMIADTNLPGFFFMQVKNYFQTF